MATFMATTERALHALATADPLKCLIDPPSEMPDQRNLAPGPSPTSSSHSPGQEQSLCKHQAEASNSTIVPDEHSAAGPWKKRVSTACLACKKSKRKCSGTSPCTNCITFHRACIFDESLDQRRRVAAKRTADELSYHRDLLHDLFTLVREADPAAGLRLLELIRGNASAEDVREYINEALASLSRVASESAASGSVSAVSASSSAFGLGLAASAPEDPAKEKVQATISKLEDMKEIINVEGNDPPFRSKVMDLNYLCDEAPIKVPAKPWTSVTDDDDLVSHLVSLYFTWDYPFHAFLDRDVFLKCMVAPGGGSEFCSAFLVNALLSNACYFSEFSEAYLVPGDISSKGSEFLAEAERLKEEVPSRPSLATLQGTLLMYERYAMSRDDDLGYIMLHEAISMGETLGLVGHNGPRMTSEQLSRDMDASCRRTAWGLFNIDTMVHTGFLRPCLISQVNLHRVERDVHLDQDVWRPYPSHRECRPSEISLYFEEACNLSTIARDISRSMFSAERVGQRLSREDLYERLMRWRKLLPGEFDEDMPPHLVLLLMRYNTLVVNLFSCISEDISTDVPKTPESPRQSPAIKYNAWQVTSTAARGIASLARLHRREYGMSRAHPFALYAVNLALFTMMEQESFDVLDQDFLSLASAFSIIASRSVLGRNLFHIFRQSVRAKAQGERIRDLQSVPDELKDLFDETPTNRGHARFNDYAEGLEKLNRDGKYHRISEGQSLQDYPGLSLSDMLDRYESLSLGKDDVLPERHRPAPC
ncbi:hypothetical protein N7532_002336 [Penicillium argentinense]|uniref:Zn(2)-C6 fungal-type domain-containing protein n=1 Tax=Penicillium argentinense TaxID=1131581 RepID=A0A9W9G057_9EURO|nr:uncharacterized protein N7532_002336 [Penicillium argentinense]KAJ5109691.1 hypothetical protein N7532_002336 [Penicillium argentinense]